MNFVESVESVFKKYVVWEGRASRSEFWWFYLFYLGCSFLTSMLDLIWGTPVLNSIFVLGTFLPMLSVTIRRLHDTGHSGWWYWIALLPIVVYGYQGRSHKVFMPIFGFMYAIKLLFTESEEGENKYGSNPLEPVT
tara:strand:- start:1226 stop:1633 length:408 start_codon:yes stop_codon:yes gene_type:complete